MLFYVSSKFVYYNIFHVSVFDVPTTNDRRSRNDDGSLETKYQICNSEQ